MAAFPLRGVQRTCLGPLHARALETQRRDGIIHDQKSLELSRQIKYSTRGIDWHVYQLHIAVRTEIIDEVVLDFMSRSPSGIVVNLGAGLDTRFYRLDNRKVRWYEVDLPNVITLRRRYFMEHKRYQFISGSVTRIKWPDILPSHLPILFIMEGFAYFIEEAEIAALFRAISAHFQKAEVVMEVLGLLSVKMTKEPLYKWGMSMDSLPTNWDPGIEVVNSWCQYDRYPERWKEFQWLEMLMAFGKNMHGVYHIRTNARPGRNVRP